jgi:hypothetical protein
LFYWFLSFSRFASWLGGSSAPAKQSTLFPRGEDPNIVELLAAAFHSFFLPPSSLMLATELTSNIT